MSRPIRALIGSPVVASMATLAVAVVLLALLSGAGSTLAAEPSMLAAEPSMFAAEPSMFAAEPSMLAAEPSLEPVPTAAGVMSGGDPRSEGEGPGVVGSPLAILAGVVVLGFATALLTVVVARLAQRD